MSYSDLYLTSSPKIISPADDSEPIAALFGIPFDSTHSYKPGCRFGPDVIRDAFNNIEIFMPEFGVDLEQVNIKDLGNMEHTVVAQNMIDMVRKTTSELKDTSNQLIILGGEHSLTYGSYLSYPKDTGYVVFDAHDNVYIYHQDHCLLTHLSIRLLHGLHDRNGVFSLLQYPSQVLLYLDHRLDCNSQS